MKRSLKPHESSDVPWHVRLSWGCVVMGALLCGSTVQAKDPTIRHFRAGALFGANLDAEFSQSGIFRSDTTPLGDFSAGWEFDDGFVRPDNSPSGSAGGFTSHWGYNSGSQYDAGTDALTFARTPGYSATDASTANSDPQLGLDLGYGGSITRIGKAWLLWDVGFSLLPITISGSSTGDATLAQERYIFDVGGIILPGAPYTGSPNSGPLLATNFTSGSPSITSGTLSADREIEAVLYNLRLGPQLHFDLTRAWSVELMGGFALGLVDGSYNFTERVSTSTGQSVTSGSLGQTDWLYGGYGGVLTQVHFEKNAYLYGSAQFMSLGNVGFSGGGRSAQLKLDQGVYFSVGFTWLF